jgi:hypothetical protein
MRMKVEAVNRCTDDFKNRQTLIPDEANPDEIQSTVILAIVDLLAFKSTL